MLRSSRFSMTVATGPVNAGSRRAPEPLNLSQPDGHVVPTGENPARRCWKRMVASP
jgi:hypothetical protein